MKCPATGTSMPGEACSKRECLMHVEHDPSNPPVGLPPIASRCLLAAANGGGENPLARLRGMIGHDGRKAMTLPVAVNAISSFGTAVNDYKSMMGYRPPASSACSRCGYTSASARGECLSPTACSRRLSVAVRLQRLFRDDTEVGKHAVPSLSQLWEAVVSGRDAHFPAELRTTMRGLVTSGDRPHQARSGA